MGEEKEIKEERLTNAKFAAKNEEFIAACAVAGVKPTSRQASKFRARKGLAWSKGRIA